MKAGIAGAIASFRGQYGFLSNFAAAKVVYAGEEYATVEHAFQAAKTLSATARLNIRMLRTPSAAKRVGRTVKLREDWGTKRIEVMRELLYKKFAPGRIHLTYLLATGDQRLVEGNTWHDTYWGVCLCPEHQGKGDNMLGQLLMEVRAARRQELAGSEKATIR